MLAQTSKPRRMSSLWLTLSCKITLSLGPIYAGASLPTERPCDSCSRGAKPFQDCRVLIQEDRNGAYTNCHWGGQSKRCRLRKFVRTVLQYQQLIFQRQPAQTFTNPSRFHYKRLWFIRQSRHARLYIISWGSFSTFNLFEQLRLREVCDPQLVEREREEEQSYCQCKRFPAVTDQVNFPGFFLSTRDWDYSTSD